MQRDKPTAWLSWRLAVERVECARGLSYGAAHKAFLDACNKDKLRYQNRPEGGPDILDVDLWRWLSPTKPKMEPRKRLKIKSFLAKKFSGQRVPDDYVRKDLVVRVRSLQPSDPQRSPVEADIHPPYVDCFARG